MAIDKELLEVLLCPKCQGDVLLTESGKGLICNCCRLLYEIKEGIPIMLAEESESLDAIDAHTVKTAQDDKDR